MMKLMVGMYLAILLLFFIFGCSQNQPKTDHNFYRGKPKANIELLVAEIGNGEFICTVIGGSNSASFTGCLPLANA